MVFVKCYDFMPFNKNEILLYAKSNKNDQDTLKIIDECITELKDKLVYNVCYCIENVEIQNNQCYIGELLFQSTSLSDNLKGCKKAVIFACTIGMELDRLINKYSYISPLKALIFQAIGTQQIEALCNTFCSEFNWHNSRFSAGYGDFKIEYQKDILNLLDCNRKIGLTLNDSLIMSPSKSVTAIMGIK